MYVRVSMWSVLFAVVFVVVVCDCALIVWIWALHIEAMTGCFILLVMVKVVPKWFSRSTRSVLVVFGETA